MNSLLEKEIAPPVTVRIGGNQYQLAYPMAAVILYKQYTGDNLCLSGTWQKIAPSEDPERFVRCLWAGLHRYDREKQTFVEQLSYPELSTLADFSNAGELTTAMAVALSSQFPKPKESDPNVPAPEAVPALPLDSEISGPSVAAI